MKLRGLLHGAAVTCLFVSAAISMAQAGSLRAGAAKVDISPTSDMYPFESLQLYGSQHDPIFVRALVLDNGSTKLAFISVESVHLNFGDELVKAVTDELKIPATNLIINATHDHNSPAGAGGFGLASTAKNPYFEILMKGIVEAAREANVNLQPARIGFGTGKAYINTNRDEKIGDVYRMGYVPDGPSDKTVAVMLVTKPSGEPIAVYSSYAVHSVVMYMTHTKDGKVQVSGDLGGAASRYVEDHFKGAVGLWTMAAAGDQNPLFMAFYKQSAPDAYDEGPSGWAILDVEARRIGEEIVRISENIQNTTGKAVLWGGQTSITCPGRKPSVPPDPNIPRGGYLPNAKVTMLDGGDPVTIPLSLLMINDIAIAGVSGEIFTEIGEHIKHDSLFDRTLMVTMLTNGVGYIPTDKAYLLPSFQAVRNRLAPGCAEPAIVGGFLQLEKSYLPIWQAAEK